LIAALSDSIWLRLCDTIGTSTWQADPCFHSVEECSETWQIITDHLGSWFAACTTQAAVHIFSGLGILVNSVAGKSIKLSRSEILVGSVPVPGQHTEEFLPTPFCPVCPW